MAAFTGAACTDDGATEWSNTETSGPAVGETGSMTTTSGSPAEPGVDASTGGGADGNTGDADTPATGDVAQTSAGDAAVPEGGSSDVDAGDAGETEPDPADAEFAACTADLRAACSYEEKEVACSSLTTAVIPLSDGGSWGDEEVQLGPYGAVVEWNMGEDFAIEIDQAQEDGCSVLAYSFLEPASVTEDILNLRGADLSLYTVFRPACMKEGETYPVITWGNGTCGQTGGYGVLLAAVASHGFVVVAPNSRWTGQGRKEMLTALDLAAAMNEDPESIFYQKLDLEHVGAMGHSQGAGATSEAAPDPRIDALILWNGDQASEDKPFLAVSGERDIGEPTAQDLDMAAQASTQPGAWLYYHKVLQTGGWATGHLTLMEQPERVIEPTVAWWKYMLEDDQEARAMFVGDSCGLCDEPEEFSYGANERLP